MLARPLTTASDPMSGFFGIHKKYVSISSVIVINNSLNKHPASILMDSKSLLISY